MRPTILPTTTERRTLDRATARPELVRAAGADSSKVRIVGHAAVFGQRVLIGRLPWGFYEDFAAGSFRDTIADGGESLGVDQAHLLDHDSYYVVSRVGASSLSLAEDKTGLAIDSEADTRVSYVADHVVNLEVGNVSGMSIGFYVDEDEWSSETMEAEGPDGKTVQIEVETRTVLRASLLEVSDVTFPAFPTTDVGLRDVAGALARRGDEKAIERYAERAPILGELVTRQAAQLVDRVRPVAPAAVSRQLDERRERGIAAMYGLTRA